MGQIPGHHGAGHEASDDALTHQARPARIDMTSADLASAVPANDGVVSPGCNRPASFDNPLAAGSSWRSPGAQACSAGGSFATPVASSPLCRRRATGQHQAAWYVRHSSAPVLVMRASSPMQRSKESVRLLADHSPATSTCTCNILTVPPLRGARSHHHIPNPAVPINPR